MDIVDFSNSSKSLLQLLVTSFLDDFHFQNDPALGERKVPRRCRIAVRALLVDVDEESSSIRSIPVAHTDIRRI